MNFIMVTVTVFGATGKTGICAVESALKKGLHVKVLVRDESKIPDDQKGQVEIVVGDVLNLDDVKRALAGSSSAVVALGTRNNLDYTTVMSDGLRNIIVTMKESGISVISTCLSAFLFYEDEKVPAIFCNINNEHKRMLAQLQESGLNWIGVSPPHIAESPFCEMVIANGNHPGPRVISKHSLGHFLIDALESPQYYKCHLGIANKPA